MPIQVVCPGCKKRFSVSEKFAGKEGPCPSCKTIIKIPQKAEEVVIHAPDHVPGTKGGKTVTGQPTFKPIRRKHLTASPIALVSILGGALVTIVAALFIRMANQPDPPPMIVPVIGAALLAFPISWGGYLFLSDPELEGYRGSALYIRVGVCALVYALLWGAWGFILRPAWGFEGQIDLPWLVFIVPCMICIGAIAPFAALDFEYLTAALHYGLYLAVTVLLGLIVGLPAF